MKTENKFVLFILFAPFVLWMLLLIIIPQLELLLLSIQDPESSSWMNLSASNYVSIFSQSIYVLTLLRTVVMSILTTILVFVISYPMAFYISKIARGRSKTFLFLACLLPFWASEIVRIFGWVVTLRETGILSQLLLYWGLVSQPIEFLYNDVAIIIGLIYTSMLFMLVPLVSAIDALDDSLIEAAYDLGSSTFTVMRKVVIPYTMPSIAAGSIVVFMLSLGSYITPMVLGGKSSSWFTAQIYAQFITRFNWELGSAFGFVLLVSSSLVVWLGLKLFNQSLSSTIGRE